MISVAIIARDEELFLRRCLESLKIIPDYEVVIGIDTRSTDKTREIAKEYNCRIIDVIWERKDFSKARNTVIDNCKGEYIFTIDADETVRKWEDPTGEFSLIQVNNVAKDIRVPHWSIRFFKSKYRYHYRVHETIEPDIKGIAGTYNKTMIDHWGYEQTPEEMKARTEEILQIHYEQLTEEPDNASVKFHIGLCEYSLKNYLVAVNFAMLSLFDNTNNETKAYSCLTIHKCYVAMGRLDLAIYWLNVSLTYCREQIYSRMLLAEYSFGSGQKEMGFTQLQLIRNIIKNQSSRLSNDYLMTEKQLDDIERKYKNAV